MRGSNSVEHSCAQPCSIQECEDVSSYAYLYTRIQSICRNYISFCRNYAQRLNLVIRGIQMPFAMTSPMVTDRPFHPYLPFPHSLKTDQVRTARSAEKPEMHLRYPSTSASAAVSLLLRCCCSALQPRAEHVSQQHT